MITCEIKMTCDEVAAITAKSLGLTKKEERLISHLLDDGKSKRIEDVCRETGISLRAIVRVKKSLEKKLDTLPDGDGSEVTLIHSTPCHENDSNGI
ncbi:hypothetical protein [Paenibacillus alvei]|uniref:hypothetical protein n=1 Tax=Paenibacillus alvei TaxID=44250 RepID=UPI002281C5E7|nr:hypothetical protein [Paenibacillus alvei]MCY7484421.1 hypothetical protein [Paenibacillus alvei]